jgi:hypothetical protein
MEEEVERRRRLKLWNEANERWCIGSCLRVRVDEGEQRTTNSVMNGGKLMWSPAHHLLLCHGQGAPLRGL